MFYGCRHRNRPYLQNRCHLYRVERPYKPFHLRTIDPLIFREELSPFVNDNIPLINIYHGYMNIQMSLKLS